MPSSLFHISRRKKFESPQQPPSITNAENPFSARGAIRRLSLRDRSGMTLARIEAQKEQSTLMRSFSKEDVTNDQFVSFAAFVPIFQIQENISSYPGGPQRTSSLNEASRNSRDSPNKRVLNKNSTKSRAHAGEEWARQLEHRKDFDDEDELQNGTGGSLAKATRGRSSTKKKKKRTDQIGKFNFNVTSGIISNLVVSEMTEIGSPTSTTALNGKVGTSHLYSTSPISGGRVAEKKGCCCIIM